MAWKDQHGGMGFVASADAWRADGSMRLDRKFRERGGRLGAWAAPKVGKVAVAAWFLLLLGARIGMMQLCGPVAWLAIMGRLLPMFLCFGASLALKRFAPEASDRCMSAAEGVYSTTGRMGGIARWAAARALGLHAILGFMDWGHRGLAEVLRRRPELAPGWAPWRWLGLSPFALAGSLEACSLAPDGYASPAKDLGLDYELISDWPLARWAREPVGLMGTMVGMGWPWRSPLSRIQASFEKARDEGLEYDAPWPEAKAWLDWERACRERGRLGEAAAEPARPLGSAAASRRL